MAFWILFFRRDEVAHERGGDPGKPRFSGSGRHACERFAKTAACERLFGRPYARRLHAAVLRKVLPRHDPM